MRPIVRQFSPTRKPAYSLNTATCSNKPSFAPGHLFVLAIHRHQLASSLSIDEMTLNSRRPVPLDLSLAKTQAKRLHEDILTPLPTAKTTEIPDDQPGFAKRLQSLHLSPRSHAALASPPASPLLNVETQKERPRTLANEIQSVTIEIPTTTEEQPAQEDVSPKSTERAASTSPQIPESVCLQQLEQAWQIPDPRPELVNVPTAYIEKKLLQMGSRYLGDYRSAHVFVKAVPLSKENMDGQTWKAKVRSQWPGRQNFSMSRELPRRLEEVEVEGKTEEDKGVYLPLHVEYAVMCAPLLGSLLLSGEIRRGDHIEIALPYTKETWIATVAWMYLGHLKEGDDDEKVRRCVEFLHNC
ncbi:hypothetical protein SAICODRAFT_185026 [Saitoella complicata NRRL Y-17804]|uniref:uncharacterized protein n=1 Tax=Saitoella complicata (strain BCRC 22490 / CBS 7301 / JCM 7358 / NBRC 10748 / NRRL Y-17804) TaxID=698492 RepID=UPI0008668567|nr:uncharacterized protein SAICODRAFT_185026 [Saitoella complicata NRRL Y-17804]ODQ55431.1 hypothetical protein SAICODRAFT_185026 [Saitoella complicata NRRL Y-17804]